MYGTPGPYEDAVKGTPIFEENGPDNFKGIDIMRTVRSFDPCLPCGVHMYLGGGKELQVHHSPMFGAQRGGHSCPATPTSAGSPSGGPPSSARPRNCQTPPPARPPGHAPPPS